MGDIRVGNIGAIFLLVNGICMQLFLGFPRRMVDAGGTAGWMIPLYTSVISLILFFFISKLYSNFEGKDIIDVAQIAGGNIGRLVVGVILIADYAFILSILLRIFGENIKVFALNQSPLSFIIMTFIIVMAISAYVGIESIVRFNSLIVPIVATAFIIIILGNVNFMDVTNLFPILGTGPYEIFIKQISGISIYSSLSAIFLVTPFLGTYKDFKKIGYWGIIISGLLLTLGTLLYVLVVPYPTSTEYLLPYLHLARYVYFGRFFQRVESIFMIAWTLAAFSYLSMGLYLLLYTVKKTFRLEYYTPLIIPIAVILYTVSFMPQSLMASVAIERQIVRNFAWVVTFAVPIVVLIMAKVIGRKKEGEKFNEKA